MSLMAQRASSAESACERRAAAAGWQVALAAAKFAENGFRPPADSLVRWKCLPRECRRSTAQGPR